MGGWSSRGGRRIAARRRRGARRFANPAHFHPVSAHQTGERAYSDGQHQAGGQNDIAQGLGFRRRLGPFDDAH